MSKPTCIYSRNSQDLGTEPWLFWTGLVSCDQSVRPHWAQLLLGDPYISQGPRTQNGPSIVPNVTLHTENAVGPLLPWSLLAGVSSAGPLLWGWRARTLATCCPPMGSGVPRETLTLEETMSG